MKLLDLSPLVCYKAKWPLKTIEIVDVPTKKNVILWTKHAYLSGIFWEFQGTIWFNELYCYINTTEMYNLRKCRIRCPGPARQVVCLPFFSLRACTLYFAA